MVRIRLTPMLQVVLLLVEVPLVPRLALPPVALVVVASDEALSR